MGLSRHVVAGVAGFFHNCKGEIWGYGELEGICTRVGLNYSTARNAQSVCEAFELSRWRDNLTFSHHQEVQGRSDADELLDWCEETDTPRSREDLREVGDGVASQNWAAEIVVMAERRAGEILARMKLQGGDRKSKSSSVTLIGGKLPTESLAEIGVTKKQSSRDGRQLQDYRNGVSMRSL